MAEIIEKYITKFGDGRKDQWLKFHKDHQSGNVHHWQDQLFCTPGAIKPNPNYQRLVCNIRTARKIHQSLYNLPFTLGEALITIYFYNVMRPDVCFDRIKFFETLSQKYDLGLTVIERRAICELLQTKLSNDYGLGKLGTFCSAVEMLASELN